MLSDKARQLAAKLADAGPTEAEAIAWVEEIIAEAVQPYVEFVDSWTPEPDCDCETCVFVRNAP